MDDSRWQRQRYLADRLALPMFSLTVLFVLLLGTLIVVRIDIPRVAELARLEQQSMAGATVPTLTGMPVGQLHLPIENAPAGVPERLGDAALVALLAIWPLFWLEYLVLLRHRAGRPFVPDGLTRLLVCSIPPLRLAAPSAARDGRVWLPALGWRRPGRALVRELERHSSKPMLTIALLILPVLAIEIGFKGLVDEHAWLRLLLHVSTGLIWCAFVIEFCLLIGATDKKLAYVRRHWLDLAIILLPLISFLRSVRALRLARLAKVQKLAKMGRVYRMRGLLMKAVRALMLLEVVNRLLRVTPEKRLARLHERRDELEEDLAELDLDIRTLERELRCDGG